LKGIGSLINRSHFKCNHRDGRDHVRQWLRARASFPFI
jgi:hypothetical protein